MRLETETQEYAFGAGAAVFQADSCYYCGDVATTVDHVPPVSTRKMYENSAVQCSYPYYEVPACKECNCGLTDKFHTLRERKSYIAMWLAKRYRKLINMPDWTEEQIAGMGRNMQTTIRANLRKREIVRARVATARSRAN